MDVIFDENTGEILKEDAGICPCLACKLEEKELMDRFELDEEKYVAAEEAVNELSVGDSVHIVLSGVVSATGTDRIRLETSDQRWIAAVDTHMISAIAVDRPEVEAGSVFVSGQDLIHVVDVKGKEALCWVRDGSTLEEYGDTFNLDYLSRLKRSK